MDEEHHPNFLRLPGKRRRRCLRILFGNMLGDGLEALPSWIHERERQPFLYVYLGLDCWMRTERPQKSITPMYIGISPPGKPFFFAISTPVFG